MSALVTALVLAILPQPAAPAAHGGMFNPAATLDASQVQDRRAAGPTAHMVVDGHTCTLQGDDTWQCVPFGRTV